jgi:hypothetical protein
MDATDDFSANDEEKAADEADKKGAKADKKIAGKGWTEGSAPHYLVTVNGSGAKWDTDHWVAGDTKVCPKGDLPDLSKATKAKPTILSLEVCED